MTITSGTKTVVIWYALDSEGSIAGVEISDSPPARTFVSSSGRYRPDDPTGAPDLTVAFNDGRLTITGRSGTTVARIEE